MDNKQELFRCEAEWNEADKDFETKITLNQFSALRTNFKTLTDVSFHECLKKVEYNAREVACTFEFTKKCRNVYKSLIDSIADFQRKSGTTEYNICKSTDYSVNGVLQYVCATISQWIHELPTECIPSCVLRLIRKDKEHHRASVKYLVGKKNANSNAQELNINIVKTAMKCYGDSNRLKSIEKIILSKTQIPIGDDRDEIIRNRLTPSLLEKLSAAVNVGRVKNINGTAGQTAAQPEPEQVVEKKKACVFEFQWRLTDEHPATEFGKQSLWDTRNYFSRKILGESLKNLQFSANDELVLTLSLDEPVAQLRKRVLACFINDVKNHLQTGHINTIDDKINNSEKNATIFRYVTYLLEQWLFKTDAEYKPYVECKVGFFSNNLIKIACDCYISDVQHRTTTPQWEMNRSIMRSLVIAAQNLSAKLPNALFAVKKHVEVYYGRESQGDYENMLIPDFTQLVERAAAPELRNNTNRAGVNWWGLLNNIPGMESIINGVSEIWAGDFEKGFQNVMTGAFTFQRNISRFLRLFNTVTNLFLTTRRLEIRS